MHMHGGPSSLLTRAMRAAAPANGVYCQFLKAGGGALLANLNEIGDPNVRGRALLPKDAAWLALGSDGRCPLRVKSGGGVQQRMSALPPKADMCSATSDV